MSVVKTDCTFKSTSKEDIDVYYAVWKDNKKKPIGVVQLTHGIAEHINRYDELASYLAKKGYIVCGQDHLGHGRTADINHILIVPDDAGKAMITDMHKLYEIMHKEYKNLPYYLYGHSMGSTMARVYIGKYGKELDGAIISGTGYAPGFTFLLNKPLALIGKLAGFDYKKEMEKADKLLIPEVNPNKRISLSDKLMNSWLSYDKKNIKAYVNDPLNGMNGNTLSFYCKAAAVLTGASKWGIYKKTPKKLPIFLISGKKDMIGLWSFGVRMVYKNFKKAGRNVKLKLYRGGKHEIHNELKIKEKVFADILKFLNKHNKLA